MHSITVIHCDFSPLWRGGQQQLFILARALRRLGLRQTIVARHEAVAARFLSDDFEVLSPRGGLRADIIHAHDAHAHTFALLRTRGRRVLSRRVAFPVRGLPSRWKFNRLDLVIAVSEAARREVPPGPPVVVIPDAIELPIVVAAAPAHWPPNASVLACLSANTPEKGIADLLAAFPLLPPDVHLVLTALPQSGLPDRVHGVADSGLDPAAWVAACNALVMPSRQEGLGSAALLAMALAKPVVATTAGGIPELVADDITGLLVPPRDPPALAAAIRCLLDDPVRAYCLGVAGLQRAQQHYDADAIAARTLAAYHKVL